VAGDIVMERFDTLPPELAEAMVLMFSQEEDPLLRTKAAKVVFSHYDGLGDECAEPAERLKSDPNVGVRRTVANTVGESFGRLPVPLRESALEELASDEDPWVRHGAAKAIVLHYSQLGEKASGLLEALLNDPDPWVSEGILEVAAANFSDLEPGLKAAYRQVASEGALELRRRAFDCLVSNREKFSDRETVELLITFLEDRDSGLRKEVAGSVAELLTTLPPKNQLGLIAALANSEDPTLRRSAGNLIMDLYEGLDPTNRAVVLDILMKDDDQSVRYSVLEGLGNNISDVGKSRASSMLEHFSADTDIWIRNLASQIIAADYEKLDQKGGELIFDLSEDEDVRVRRTTLLGVIKNMEGIPAPVREQLLKPHLNSDDPYSRRVLAEAAAVHWESASPELREHLLKTFASEELSERMGAASAVMENYESLPKHVRDRCLSLIEPGSTEETRRAFMDVIGERYPMLPEELRKKVIYGFIEDESPWIRARAVDALNSHFAAERLGTVKQVVLKLMDDENAEVKESILYLLLEHLHHLEKTGLKAIQPYMRDDESPFIRVRAASVMMRHKEMFGDEVMPFIISIAGELDPMVRFDLLEAIMEEGENLPLDDRIMLLELFSSDDDEGVREIVLEILNNIKLPGAP
jgi:HEAT repeat protein